MTENDFDKFRQLGENVGIEFKRGGNGAQTDTFESICAFLNRFGGDLFLGVENNLQQSRAPGVFQFQTGPACD